MGVTLLSIIHDRYEAEGAKSTGSTTPTGRAATGGMMETRSESDVLVLASGEGRAYECGAMRAVFKADEGETGERYSVSEWWLQPGCTGPGAHSHEANDELFYVLEGPAVILTGETWVEASAGTFVRIPAGVVHDFRNTTDKPAGLLNVFLPGGFERHMPKIVEWFAEHGTE
jgi:quercetin dioxygenase-like cupin family protein